MTPLMIASKFHRVDVMNGLLELGASITAQDVEGNTPLHFSTAYRYFDKRLFSDDNESTYSKQDGMSHFHIACRYCNDDWSNIHTIDIAKNYLKLGISPDIQIRDCKKPIYAIGSTALHIVGHNPDRGSYRLPDWCPEMAVALLEFGADLGIKDVDGKTPLQKCIDRFKDANSDSDILFVKYVCTLIENGAKLDDEHTEILSWCLRHLDISVELLEDFDISWEEILFLRCIVRMTILDERMVSQGLETIYNRLGQYEEFEETEYSQICREELNKLHKMGLRQELDGT